MANGDAAAAAGLTVFSGTQDHGLGYDNDNIRGDELAAHITGGGHPWGKISGKPATFPAAAGSVDTDQLVSGAVTGAKIANGAVTASKIASGSVSADELASGAVTESKIASGAVSGSKLATGSVTASKIAANSVTGSELAPNSVGNGHIVDGVVGNSKIANGAVDTAQLATDAVTGSRLAANSVGSGHIVAGAVDTSELANGAVTSSKLASSVNFDEADKVTSSAYSRQAGSSRYSMYMDGDRNIGRATSSRRYKEDIHDAALDPDAVLALRPVTFHRKNEPTDIREFGLIAEEVQEAGLEDLVVWLDGRIDGVRYELLAVALLAVVQQQRDDLSALAARVAELEQPPTDQEV